MPKPSDYDLLPHIQSKRLSILGRVKRGPTPDDCWLWMGGKTQNGYGSITMEGTSVRAHRAMFMLAYGRSIAEGMTLHHSCHVLACVNPRHLSEMTIEENQHLEARGASSIRERVTRRGVIRFAVLFRDGGKQSSRTFATRDEAEAFRAKRATEFAEARAA